MLRSLVKRRIQNLDIVADDCLADIRHFLRTFINQHDDDMHLRIIPQNGTGNILQQGCLSCLGRRYDQSSLSLAYRRKEVDDPHGNFTSGALHFQALIRKDRRHVLEIITSGRLGGGAAVDQFYEQESGKLLLLGVDTGVPAYDIACLETELPDLGGRYINVILSG